MRPGDVSWLIKRHGALYAAEEGFDESFSERVGHVLADYVAHRDASCERAWIAQHNGRQIGSVFCMREGRPGVARLRLFLIEPAYRGQGLGARMLARVLTYARDCGYYRLAVSTYASHDAACALYARYGFVLTEERPVQSFGQSLVEQSWEIVL
ncbi:acetyltransferase (GNAT) family protein [Rhodovulum imhoffii]|uniref:Acetyltransferase (GNAT) family protein n=2 Tax=Rhodovulum imhoffii TaxID=365340 RepID=A0A2T5BVU5_9RHOB|nr:GNAT family N-acetyltransferase [Rhodovulum imhoffii]PTN03691.1 acetyltransferase (GNAT) family protein [Rhodovulum imhoffii]